MDSNTQSSQTSEQRWTKFQILIAFLMVITGTINTLSIKWADTMISTNSAGEKSTFNHPFFQADGMFLGETLCLVAFYVMRCIKRAKRRARVELAPSLSDEYVNFPKIIFYIPAFCDMLATSTMYVGLTLTYASSFQMLRGAVIVFTGLLSVAFLGRTLRYYQWLGIVSVIGGLVTVGLSDFLGEAGNSQYDTNAIITGDLLIIAAQVITAAQMVIEEKFLSKFKVPALQVVGLEGIFGFITLTFLMIPFYYIPGGKFSGSPRGVLEDALDALTQLSNNGLLVLAILGNVFSIAFFNFAGVSVTKEISATTRMVLDSVRTLFIWISSLAFGWQNFYYLQPIGFTILVIGMFLYNDVIILPFFRQRGWLRDQRDSEETAPIRNEAEPIATSDDINC